MKPFLGAACMRSLVVRVAAGGLQMVPSSISVSRLGALCGACSCAASSVGVFAAEPLPREYFAGLQTQHLTSTVEPVAIEGNGLLPLDDRMRSVYDCACKNHSLQGSALRNGQKYAGMLLGAAAELKSPVAALSQPGHLGSVGGPESLEHKKTDSGSRSRFNGGHCATNALPLGEPCAVESDGTLPLDSRIMNVYSRACAKYSSLVKSMKSSASWIDKEKSDTLLTAVGRRDRANMLLTAEAELEPCPTGLQTAVANLTRCALAALWFYWGSKEVKAQETFCQLAADLIELVDGDRTVELEDMSYEKACTTVRRFTASKPFQTDAADGLLQAKHNVDAWDRTKPLDDLDKSHCEFVRQLFWHYKEVLQHKGIDESSRAILFAAGSRWPCEETLGTAVNDLKRLVRALLTVAKSTSSARLAALSIAREFTGNLIRLVNPTNADAINDSASLADLQSCYMDENFYGGRKMNDDEYVDNVADVLEQYLSKVRAAGSSDSKYRIGAWHRKELLNPRQQKILSWACSSFREYTCRENCLEPLQPALREHLLKLSKDTSFPQTLGPAVDFLLLRIRALQQVAKVEPVLAPIELCQEVVDLVALVNPNNKAAFSDVDADTYEYYLDAVLAAGSGAEECAHGRKGRQGTAATSRQQTRPQTTTEAETAGICTKNGEHRYLGSLNSSKKTSTTKTGGTTRRTIFNVLKSAAQVFRGALLSVAV